MSFFSSIFGGIKDVKGTSYFKGVLKIYYDGVKETNNFASLDKIDPSITIKELKENNAQVFKDIEHKHLQESPTRNDEISFNFYLIFFDSKTSAFCTGVKLKETSKPVQYLQLSKNYLCYLPSDYNQININRMLQKVSDSEKGDEKCENRQKKKNLTFEPIIQGDIERYSSKKKKFIKKRAGLNEELFKILSSKKLFQIPVNLIENNSFTNKIKENFPDVPEEILKKKYLFYLAAKEKFLFRVKKESDFRNWISCLGDVITLRNMRIADSFLNEQIEMEKVKSRSFLEAVLGRALGDPNDVLSIEDIKQYIFYVFNNQQYTDILDRIYIYKESYINKDFLGKWRNFKEIGVISKISNINNETSEQKEKIEQYASQKQIEIYNKMMNELNDLLKDPQVFNDLVTSQDSKNILPIDLFDDLSNTLIKNVISPFIEELQKNKESKKYKEYLEIIQLLPVFQIFRTLSLSTKGFDHIKFEKRN